MSEHQQQLFLTLMNQLQLDNKEFLQPDFDQASLTKIDITPKVFQNGVFILRQIK